LEVKNEGDIHYKQLVKNTGRDFADYFLEFDFIELVSGTDIHHNYCNNTKEEITSQMFYSKLRKMCGIYGWNLHVEGRGQEKKLKIIK